MYTILENVRILISLLKKHNIRKFVISPGGSNVPLVQGLQSDPFFTCYSVVDERSSMYFAIGLYLESGEIIGTSCTSAQATRNYIPGLTEAFYKHVPILAITMSKHPRFWGQEYMQCPIQTSLPVDAVKKTFNVPIIRDDNNRALCVRTINEAILELSHNSYGPVQLNVEELDSETWTFDDKLSLPEVRKIERINYWQKINSEELVGKKILVVIGEHRGFTQCENTAIDDFVETNNVVIYKHHISNFHGKYSLNANLVLYTMQQDVFDEEYAPDIVIAIGGTTGDYGIFNRLFNSRKEFEVWRVNMDGAVVDTYNKLTRIYQLTVIDFFSRFVNSKIADHSYFSCWNRAVSFAKHDIELPFSNAYVAQKLSSIIPKYSNVHFAINNSLRVWGFFDLDPTIKAFSNVAAFGIDGCLSTLIGQSVESNNINLIITGDLAFLYDINSLSIRHIKNNLRIVIINNNGGMEFKFSDLRNQTDVSSFIAADNHFANAEGWSRTCGLKYLSAHNKNEFNDYLKQFFHDSNFGIVLEIFTTPEDERSGNSQIQLKNVVKSTDYEHFNPLKGFKSIFKK